MAVPPSVPTSFVPRPATGGPRGGGFDFGGAFAFVGYGALLLALLIAAGVFAYEWYLTGVEEGKRAELRTAEASIDPATVENFIRLSSRLVEGRRLLDSHLIVSNVFELVESLIPTSVRLTSLAINSTDNSGLTLTANGTAGSLNALAVLSSTLGTGVRIKDAIFSNISVLKGGGVSFSLSASVDPALTAFTAAPAAEAPAPTP